MFFGRAKHWETQLLPPLKTNLPILVRPLIFPYFFIPLTPEIAEKAANHAANNINALPERGEYVIGSSSSSGEPPLEE